MNLKYVHHAVQTVGKNGEIKDGCTWGRQTTRHWLELVWTNSIFDQIDYIQLRYGNVPYMPKTSQKYMPKYFTYLKKLAKANRKEPSGRQNCLLNTFGVIARPPTWIEYKEDPEHYESLLPVKSTTESDDPTDEDDDDDLDW